MNTDTEYVDVTREARQVVIVAMSARSGSSWLVEQLKQSDEVLHFRGELTTFLRLHGLTPPAPDTPSEALSAAAAANADARFRRDLTAEAGHPLASVDSADRFAADILRRLPLQWPEHDFGPVSDLVQAAARQAAASGPDFSSVRFTRDLLDRIARIVPIEPEFHDFGREPAAAPDGSYPFSYVLESPPFLLFAPWKPATRQEIRDKPLIIKSAGDVYRLDFYRALFPNARLRILHLRRNPAAAINGLMNAWLSSKYQSFRVGNLAIDGYSELAAWRRQWWKLDLPPGWESYRDRPLPQVCEWQWRNAQHAVLDWCEANGAEPFVARYEDMIASAASHARLIETLCEWLSIPRFVPAQTRLMNASTPPRRGAWKSREAEILPVIETLLCHDAALRLGYGADHQAWF